MDSVAQRGHARDLHRDNGVELFSKIGTTPTTCTKDKYLVGFDCRFKRIFRKGEFCALRLIRNLQSAIGQKLGSAFVLVTTHCIFTIAEICEGTEQHLAVEEFLSPYPLVVVLEKTVAQCQPLILVKIGDAVSLSPTELGC